jgi:AcrR family transcriptional regulator
VSITDMNIARAPRRYRQTTRAESAAATGRRIVGAFVEQLSKQWYDEVTLDRVAEDAGVTVQTIVRRFGGKVGLLSHAIGAMKLQAKQRRASPPGDIERLVRNLIDDYEISGDTVIRLHALEQRHPALHEQLKLARGWHRKWIRKVFADQLAKLPAKERGATLDALVIATDVYTWKLLRRDMGRSLAATRAAMKSMIRSAVAPNVIASETR